MNLTVRITDMPQTNVYYPPFLPPVQKALTMKYNLFVFSLSKKKSNGVFLQFFCDIQIVRKLWALYKSR